MLLRDGLYCCQISSYSRFCKLFRKDPEQAGIAYLKRRHFEFVDMIRDTNELVQIINAKTPFFAGRMGSTEADVVNQYLKKKCGLRKRYLDNTVKWLLSTSGFFLENSNNIEQQIDEFAELLISCFPTCDYISSCWPPVQQMMFMYNKYLKHAKIAVNSGNRYNDFGPYPDVETSKTWLKALEGKKVLLVSSFPDTIQYQYQRKEIFAYNQECVLPDFTLLTYRTFSTQFGEKPEGYDTFYQVLQKMVDDIAKIDFDVAIVGAGAYGFPLSCNIKKRGKIAIETCGCTPLFFGIYGERQLTDNLMYKPYINENWIRPIEEPPKRYKEIENGCYW